MSDAAPVVLVPGFWHGSWCWSPVTEHLAARGIRSVALDLDGHGLRGTTPRARWARPFDAEAFAREPSPVAEVTASSAAAGLAGRIRVLAAQPCLVVAHSMAGVVATALAELAPELVGGLLYVAAFAPVSGLPGTFYSACPENAGEKLMRLLVADPAAIGAARIDFDDPERHEQIKETFYADVDDRTADAAIALLSPDAPAGVHGEELAVTRQRYGRVPHWYVTCGQDHIVPPALQHRFIREIDAVSAARTTVSELESSHSPFLSQPAALAGMIAAAAESVREQR